MPCADEMVARRAAPAAGEVDVDLARRRACARPPGGDRRAVGGVDAAALDQRREPGAVQRRQHGVVGAALRDVDAERGHLHAAAAVRPSSAPARASIQAHGITWLRRILAAGEEIAVAAASSAAAPAALISCAAIVGVAQVAVVGEPRRNERAGERLAACAPSITCVPGPSTQAIVPSARMQRQRSSPGAAPDAGNAGSSQGANQVSSHSPSPPIGGLEAITTRQRWSGVVAAQPAHDEAHLRARRAARPRRSR